MSAVSKHNLISSENNYGVQLISITGNKHYEITLDCWIENL